MAFYQALPWHEGEDKIHKLTRVPPSDNPTQPMLHPLAARRVSASPTIALGAIDKQDRVWCTIWGGDVPIAQQVARGVIGIRTQVDASFDPVVQALYEGKDDGEVVRQEGKMISGLSIHLEERDRVKLFGRMMAGSLMADDSQTETTSDIHPTMGQRGRMGNAQLVFHVTQSLGNCPKYLNKKIIRSYQGAKPHLISESPLLSSEAISHIHSADLFFIASRGPEDMDCNHRGGLPGFLRVQPQTASTPASVLVWPEYSGNNLYQTLGNITTNPSIGLVVPDFTNGNVLYLTGNAEILIDTAATSIIQKTKLAVRFTVTAARFVHDGLAFRGTPSTDNKDVSSSNPIVTHDITNGMSPYNPRIRYLTSETNTPTTSDSLPPDEWRARDIPSISATLVKKTKLTPTITKYRFRLTSSDPSLFNPSNPPLWKVGQYVALDFSDELFMGYSHMRDDDPTSLNDDFTRTFTITSPYKPNSSNTNTSSTSTPELEIITRTVGTVTKWLSQQNDRAGPTTVAVRGFSGSFNIVPPPTPTTTTPQSQTSTIKQKQNVFIAAGIGITPLLAHLPPSPASTSTSTSILDPHHKSNLATTTPTNNQESHNSNPLSSLSLLYTLQAPDIPLLHTILPLLPSSLRRKTQIFITGLSTSSSSDLAALHEIETSPSAKGITFFHRRLTEADVLSIINTNTATTDGAGDWDGEVENWYICTSPAMRRQIQTWLGEGRRVVFENFDY